MKTRRFCPYCGRPVLKSRNKGYAFQCYGCDENFYRFEVLKTRQVEQVREIRRIAYGLEVEDDCGYMPNSFRKPYPKYRY